MKKNILIACEESQTVCKAFRQRGFNAFSCDIQACSGGHPEWHFLGDCLKVIQNKGGQLQNGQEHFISGNWDLIIAHPPCTYLSNAGARWLWKGKKLDEQRYKMGLAAKDFFIKIYNSDCEFIAIENPVSSSIFEMPKYSQFVQPFQFGHEYSKKTCFWLKGLPPLLPTSLIKEHKPYITSGSYTKEHNKKFKGVSRKGGSAKIRSKTFPGIANAMAEQWGNFIMQK